LIDVADTGSQLKDIGGAFSETVVKASADRRLRAGSGRLGNCDLRRKKRSEPRDGISFGDAERYALAGRENLIHLNVVLINSVGSGAIREVVIATEGSRAVGKREIFKDIGRNRVEAGGIDLVPCEGASGVTGSTGGRYDRLRRLGIVDSNWGARYKGRG
jgi:hypothetical protein